MQKGSARVDARTPGWKGEERQKWNASKVIPHPGSQSPVLPAHRPAQNANYTLFLNNPESLQVP